MIFLFYLILSLFSPSSCSRNLDGKDHFDFKYEDEYGIENLYVLPYIEIEQAVRDGKTAGPSNPVQIAAPRVAALSKRADDRPHQLMGPFAEYLEKRERSLGMYRRKFYCNLVWSSWDAATETFSDRYQIYYHAIHYVTFDNLECDDLSRIARQQCFHFVKEAFHGSVSPLSSVAIQNACDYFRTTIWPKEKRRIYLVYKVDNCDKRVYKKLGDVCCWKCVGKSKQVSNSGCSPIPPENCDVIQENKQKANPEKLLLL